VFILVRRAFPKAEVDDDFADHPRYNYLVAKTHRILVYHNSYYQNLSKSGKWKFLSRIIYLLDKKHFIGYHDLKISFEMRVVIYSAQVQLTFGYNNFSLPVFKRIIIYPKQFYSRYFERDVKGLTSGMGFVTLSWLDTLHGFQDEDDNLNLALHEMSHALIINLQKNQRKERELVRLFEKYDDDIYEEFKRMQANNNRLGYLRNYALANRNEFFAVCIEHFFESPEEFEKRMGNLYRSFCYLLNQNPLNTHNDYRLNEKSI
jgi:Mlc titration factor MtfA (ptsG expression regulator)